eukprot:10300078-Lingulodinium_polyedra.AAC.1
MHRTASQCIACTRALRCVAFCPCFRRKQSIPYLHETRSTHPVAEDLVVVACVVGAGGANAPSRPPV